MRGELGSEIIASWARWRLRLGDFFSRMWLVKACRPLTEPVPVVLKRCFAPECVFILGMASEGVWQTSPKTRLLGHVRNVGRDGLVGTLSGVLRGVLRVGCFGLLDRR